MQAPADIAPTPTLTNEVILRILFFCTAADPIRWFTVTHVCRRWRELALSAYYLWNILHLPKSGTLEYIGAFLQRARPHWKCLPLMIYQSTSLEFNLSLTVAAHVLTLADGISILHLNVPPHKPNPANHSSFPAKCPGLPRFINAQRLTHLEASGDSRWTANLYAPNIRFLRVNYYPGFWSLLTNMPRLDHLVVWKILEGYSEVLKSSATPAFDEVATALMRPAALRKLSLFCDFDSLTDNPTTVHLPYLEELILAGPFDNCILFLRMAKVPKRTSIDLTWMSPEWPRDAMTGLNMIIKLFCWQTNEANTKVVGLSPVSCTPAASDEQSLPSICTAQLEFVQNGMVAITMLVTDAQDIVVGSRIRLGVFPAWLPSLSKQLWWNHMRQLSILRLSSLRPYGIALHEMLGNMRLTYLGFTECNPCCAGSLLCPLFPGQPTPLPHLTRMYFASMPFAEVGPVSVALKLRRWRTGKRFERLELRNHDHIGRKHMQFLTGVVEKIVYIS